MCLFFFLSFFLFIFYFFCLGAVRSLSKSIKSSRWQLMTKPHLITAEIRKTCKQLSFLLPDLRKGKCFERTILQVPRKKERVSTLGRAKQQKCIEVSPRDSCSFDLLDRQIGLNRKGRQKWHIILMNKYGQRYSGVLHWRHSTTFTYPDECLKKKKELKQSKGPEHQLKNAMFFSSIL